MCGGTVCKQTCENFFKALIAFDEGFYMCVTSSLYLRNQDMFNDNSWGLKANEIYFLKNCKQCLKIEIIKCY